MRTLQAVDEMASDREAAGNASEHLVRLWAFQESDRLWRSGDDEGAAELATTYRLVTPTTGAVVLENDAQYEQAGLSPPPKPGSPSAFAVPSIPEPETWALLIVGSIVTLFALRRRVA